MWIWRAWSTTHTKHLQASLLLQVAHDFLRLDLVAARRWLGRASLFALFVVPGAPVSIVAGGAKVPPHHFAAATTAATASRLLVLRCTAGALAAPLDTVLQWVHEHGMLAGIAASVLAIAGASPLIRVGMGMRSSPVHQPHSTRERSPQPSLRKVRDPRLVRDDLYPHRH